MKRTGHPAAAADVLAQLGIAEAELTAQGIAAQALIRIYHDFLQRRAELEEIAANTSRSLQQLPGVHAVRYRVKDPLHLLRKVIRKKTEYPDRHLNEHNYIDWINDLAGVRLLYLYKSDWHTLGRHIQSNWELKRPPIAYLTPGTPESTVQQFVGAGADIRWHEHRYRAVHYVVRTQAKKQRYFVEIQLRTLFEEGWSEIDHSVRYPNHSCNTLVQDLLYLLNHFTGQADLLASFIKFILEKQQQNMPLTEQEFTQFQTQLNQLAIPDSEKQKLYLHLQRLSEGTK